ARVPAGEVECRAGEGEVGGGAGDDVEGGRVGVERAGAGADREGAGERAGDGLGGEATGRGRRAQAADGAGTVRLGECDDGGVVAAFEVAGGVADVDGQGAHVPGGEVGGRAGEGEVIRGAGDDAERCRVGVERVGTGGDRER